MRTRTIVFSMLGLLLASLLVGGLSACANPNAEAERLNPAGGQAAVTALHSLQSPAQTLGITPSSSSTDSALLSRADGALVLRRLADGYERILLEPTLYDLSGDAVRVAIGWPPRVSPDGQWLLVPTPRNGTWLVSLDGSQRSQISAERLTATWAPDSRRMAFTYERGPEAREQDREIFVQDVISGVSPRLLVSLPNAVQYPTWSPGCEGEFEPLERDCGRSVAAVTSDDSSGWAVVRIDVESGRVMDLRQFTPRRIESTPSMLKWSPRGDYVEVETENGQVAFPLQGAKFSPVNEDCRAPLCAPSPDARLRARVENVPGQAGSSRLVVARVDTGASVTYDAVFLQAEGVRWTNDGRRVLVNSYVGPAYTLWAIDPATGKAERVADNVYFLGTPHSE